MKKLLMLLVVAMGVGSLFAAQYTDENGRTWFLDSETWGTTKVSGETVTRWKIAGCDPLPEGDFTVPAKIGDFTIYGIGANAFENATNLTSVTISEGIKRVGQWAFGPDTEAADYYSITTKLVRVSLPAGLEYLHARAFAHSKIELENEKTGWVQDGYLIKYTGTNETFTVPAGVKVIAVFAFAWLPFDGNNVASLKQINFNDGLEKIQDNAFCDYRDKDQDKYSFDFGDVKLPDSLTSIGSKAFNKATFKSLKLGKGITDLKKVSVNPLDGTARTFSQAFNSATIKSIDFGDGVESIPSSLFSDKTTLKSVRFGAALRAIGYEAFNTCTQLTNVDFTAATALESIGSSAFCGTKLSSIDLSKCTMLKTIGDKAFYGSTNLSEIVLNDGLEVIGSDAFGFPGRGDSANFKLTKVVIPSSVTTLGSGVFSSCTNLWDITGGEGVVDFDGYFGYGVPAFACEEFDKDGKTPLPFQVLKFGKTALGFQGSCKSALTAEDFGDINTIREEAFNGEGNASVSNLVSVAFPAGLEIIGESAFAYAENLATVDFGANVTNVSVMSSAFVDTAIAELKGDFRMIGDMAFAQCEKLANVDVSVIAVNGDGGGDPEEPRSGVIYSGAFSECTNLQTVVLKAYGIDRFWIEDGERYSYVYGGWICDEVLSECPALKQVEIEADGEYVGQVFGGDYDALTSVKLNMPEVGNLCNGLTNLTAVTLGTLVERIGANAFNGCSNLVTVTQAEGGELKQIDKYAFLGTKFYDEAPAGALKLGSMLVKWTGEEETVTIPDDIAYIASSAFIGSKAVKVIVPAKVGIIRPYTFENCQNLAQVEFKNREIHLSVVYDYEVSAAYRCAWYSECPLLAAAEEVFDWYDQYKIPVKALQVPNRGAFILAGWKPYGDWIMPDYEKLAFHNDASADGDFVPGSSYSGWIMNGQSDGNNYVVGTVTVKTGKLDKNNEVKVTMTVQLAGVKKNYTAMFKIDENGKAVISDASAEQFSDLAGMYLGGTWLSGQVKLAGRPYAYTVRGANSGKEALAGMDGFAGKVWGAALLSSTSELAPVVNGYSALSISVAKKGKVKVSGTLADGQKISATAQMAAGDNGVYAAPFYVQTNGKKGGLGFVIDFYMDGESPRAWFEKEDAGVGNMTRWQYPLEFGVTDGIDAQNFVWIDLDPVDEGELFEIDPKGNGFAEGVYDLSGYFNEYAENALCVACKSPFVVNELNARLTVNAKGKWTFAKAAKVTLATEKDLEKYQDDLDAALKDWREDGYDSFPEFYRPTSDGKQLYAYDFDYDEVLGTYTPTAYLLEDFGAKVKGGEVIPGDTSNYYDVKLSYAKKTGLVKGSSVYYWVDVSKADKPKLKKGKTSISGILIDGTIYGASTVKGVASGEIRVADPDLF